MKSAVKTKARKTNNQASFRQSLLKNNMKVEAAMELPRHLDETGSPLVCMLGLHQVCIKFASGVFFANPNFMLGLDFCPNFMLGLDSLHNVRRWFASDRGYFLGKYPRSETCKPTANFGQTMQT